MLVINFRECCKRCQHRDVYVDEDRPDAGSEDIEVFTTIGCEHERVCKEYNDPTSIASEITKLIEKYKPALVPQTKDTEVEFIKPSRRMTPREVSNELRKVAKFYKGKITELGIAMMAEDAADAIDSLQVFVDLINSLSNCNDCINKDCGIRPGLGKTVRYNCPIYKGGEKQCSTNVTSVKD